MKWIQGQSKFLLKTVFRRNYDTMAPDAQKTIDLIVLGIDLASILALITLL